MGGWGREGRGEGRRRNQGPESKGFKVNTVHFRCQVKTKFQVSHPPNPVLPPPKKTNIFPTIIAKPKRC